MQTLKLVVNPGGSIEAIYCDDLAPLLDQGDAFIARASSVEPSVGGWTATMHDHTGTKLGPFRLRQTALDAEVDYLEKMLGL